MKKTKERITNVNYAKKIQREEKGITLIALVITILVLIILAGVAIITLTGDNGIINRAQQAKERTEQSGKEELMDLILAEWKIRKETEQINLEDFLQEKKDNGEISSFTKNNGTYEVNKDGDIVVLTEDGRKATLLSMLGDNPSEHYGDTINYGIDLDTGNNDEGHIPGWKIFYANNEGTFIIASDYLRTDNQIVEEALEKANIEKFDRYIAGWLDESNLTKKDTEGNAIIDSNASKFMYNWTYGGMKMENKIAVAALLDTNAWSGFLTDGATMAIGGPTLEMFRASWNEKTYKTGTHTKLQIAPAEDIDEEYGYYVGVSNDDSYKPTSEYVTVSTDAGYGDSLYFPHSDRPYGLWNNCWGYWFASPAADDSTLVRVIYNIGYLDCYDYDDIRFGIRPVVFLPSNVSAVQDENGVWQIIK